MSERVDLITAHNACITHAKNLIASAQAVQAAEQPHIAYHLAVIALEELGRMELLGIQSMASNRSEEDANRHDKHIQSHVQKLFWCFLGPSFSSKKITNEELDSITHLAQELHSKRLQALYVDKASDALAVPSEVISIEECEKIIKLAEARLAIAEAEKPRSEAEISDDDNGTMRWFLAAADHPDKTRVIFSGASMAKLHELANARKWIRWLKSEFDKTEAKNLALAEAEIARSQNLPNSGMKNKWRIRLRIYSASHSIRPKTLTEWNEKVRWIKLIPVSKSKNQLIVELILKDNIPVQGLWHSAWGVARHFVAALNIGTMGFWWWKMPEQVDSYYERIDDLENGYQIKLTRSPSLKVDWGDNRVLTSEDLAQVINCLVALPGPGDAQKLVPYNYYIGGTTFLSLNDVHWQCEDNIFGNFLECLRKLMEETGEWNPEAPFPEALSKFVDNLITNTDEDKERLINIAKAFDANEMNEVTVTLKDASFMKFFCDAYILMKICPRALERITKEAR
ncbi:AbiV family abortive infection protein [Methylococcus sp. EFPC2]|uniref:AbiV family abortive infection protein n=1 Tax=Methylococcus sp. EFPC2 TaxID=2812648 RepID=UPI00196741F0|nr:AbiV family abortive infection protein [Methylococcus sp. EFPC2]QSA96305.1 AbiV family abortive infection protein [Methylococcus sp. EFPC2]